MVEFAIAIPVLAILMFAIVDGSRLAAADQAVSTASREAARYGSAIGENDSGVPRFIDCAGIRDAARAAVAVVDLEDDQIDIWYDSGPGTPSHEVCPAGVATPDPTAIASGDRVVVNISADFQSNIPFLSSVFSKTIQSTDHRTIFRPYS